MEKQSTEFWKKANRARDHLVAHFIDHPDVTLIDIGFEPGQEKTTDQVVLRIHVRERWIKASQEERTAFPNEVEGIPVIVIPGEYRLEKE